MTSDLCVHLLGGDLGAALLGLEPERLLQLLTPPLLLHQSGLQQLHLLPAAVTRPLLHLLQLPHVLRLHQTEGGVGLHRLHTSTRVLDLNSALSVQDLIRFSAVVLTWS